MCVYVHAHVSGGEAEREGDRGSKVGSALMAKSSRNHEIMT